MKTEDLDVLLLCGGLGRRLRSIAGVTPKVMMKAGSRCFLDVIIEYMSSFGFRRYILAVGHKAAIIKNHYNKNIPFRSEIIFSYESVPLDTGGAVKKARKLIRSTPFFVLNGDSFCRFNPVFFLNFHKMKGASASILLRKKTNVSDYGSVTIDSDSGLSAFAKNLLLAGVPL